MCRLLGEKQQLAELLAELRANGAVPAEVNIDPLPTYYPKLRGLIIRVMRRPDRVLPTLRLPELLTAVAALGTRVQQATSGHSTKTWPQSSPPTSSVSRNHC